MADESSATGVKVAVRVRPFIEEEYARLSAGASPTLCVAAPSIQSLDISGGNSNRPQRFDFDRVYWSHNPEHEHFATQATLYEEIGQQTLQHLLNGFNTCMFAYGQTGSGKSYSVLGQDTPEGRGLLPRVVEGLFDRLDAGAADLEWNCVVSFMEIYNESIRDLLIVPEDLQIAPKVSLGGKKASMVPKLENSPSASPRPGLEIRQLPGEGVVVHGLTETAVSSKNETLDLIDVGMSHRTVGATAMNNGSSRSHCIFTFKTSITGRDGLTRRSQTHLVDLAGSERAARTQAEGNRLKEGAAINQSLSTLASVIRTLAENQEKKRNNVPPFRDSKLTRILQESLCGNSKTIMMAAISPSAEDYEETVSTLRFAQTLKRVQLSATANEQNLGEQRAREEANRMRVEIQMALMKASKARNVDELAAALEKASKYDTIDPTHVRKAEAILKAETAIVEARKALDVAVAGKNGEELKAAIEQARKMNVDSSHIRKAEGVLRDEEAKERRAKEQEASGGPKEDKDKLAIGVRVSVVGKSGAAAAKGLVRYHGATKFAAGVWVGIELDKPVGKNDGSVQGVSYFTCPPEHGVFVRPAAVALAEDELESPASPAASAAAGVAVAAGDSPKLGSGSRHAAAKESASPASLPASGRAGAAVAEASGGKSPSPRSTKALRDPTSTKKKGGSGRQSPSASPAPSPSRGASPGGHAESRDSGRMHAPTLETGASNAARRADETAVESQDVAAAVAITVTAPTRKSMGSEAAVADAGQIAPKGEAGVTDSAASPTNGQKRRSSGAGVLSAAPLLEAGAGIRPPAAATMPASPGGADGRARSPSQGGPVVAAPSPPPSVAAAVRERSPSAAAVRVVPAPVSAAPAAAAAKVFVADQVAALAPTAAAASPSRVRTASGAGLAEPSSAAPAPAAPLSPAARTTAAEQPPGGSSRTSAAGSTLPAATDRVLPQKSPRKSVLQSNGLAQDTGAPRVQATSGTAAAAAERPGISVSPTNGAVGSTADAGNFEAPQPRRPSIGKEGPLKVAPLQTPPPSPEVSTQLRDLRSKVDSARRASVKPENLQHLQTVREQVAAKEAKYRELVEASDKSSVGLGGPEVAQEQEKLQKREALVAELKASLPALQGKVASVQESNRTLERKLVFGENMELGKELFETKKATLSAESELEGARLELTTIELKSEEDIEERIKKACKGGKNFPKKATEFQEALRVLGSASGKQIFELSRKVEHLDRSFANLSTLQNEAEKLTVQQDQSQEVVTEMKTKSSALVELLCEGTRLEETRDDLESELQQELDTCSTRGDKLEHLVKELHKERKDAEASISSDRQRAEELLKQLCPAGEEAEDCSGSSLAVRGARKVATSLRAGLAEIERRVEGSCMSSFKDCVPQVWVPQSASSQEPRSGGRKSLHEALRRADDISALELCLHRADALATYTAKGSAGAGSAGFVRHQGLQACQLCFKACHCAAAAAQALISLGPARPGSLTLTAISASWQSPEGRVCFVNGASGEAKWEDAPEEESLVLAESGSGSALSIRRSDGWWLDMESSSAWLLVWQKEDEEDMLWRRNLSKEENIWPEEGFTSGAALLGQLLRAVRERQPLEEKSLEALKTLKDQFSAVYLANSGTVDACVVAPFRAAYALRQTEGAYNYGADLAGQNGMRPLAVGEPAPEQQQAEWAQLAARLRPLADRLRAIGHAGGFQKEGMEVVELEDMASRHAQLIEKVIMKGPGDVSTIQALHSSVRKVKGALDDLERVPGLVERRVVRPRRRAIEHTPLWADRSVAARQEYNAVTGMQRRLNKVSGDTKERQASLNTATLSLTTDSSDIVHRRAEMAEMLQKGSSAELTAQSKLACQVAAEASVKEKALQQELGTVRARRDKEGSQRHDLMSRVGELEEELRNLRRPWDADDGRTSATDLATMWQMRVKGARELYEWQVSRVETLTPLPTLPDKRVPAMRTLAESSTQYAALQKDLLWERSSARLARLPEENADFPVLAEPMQEQVGRMRELQVKAAHIRRVAGPDIGAPEDGGDTASAGGITRPGLQKDVEAAATAPALQVTVQMGVPKWATAVMGTAKVRRFNVDFQQMFGIHDSLVAGQ